MTRRICVIDPIASVPIYVCCGLALRTGPRDPTGRRRRPARFVATHARTHARGQNENLGARGSRARPNMEHAGRPAIRHTAADAAATGRPDVLAAAESSTGR